MVAREITQNAMGFIAISNMAASGEKGSSSGKKRERSANWTSEEIILLVDLVEEELGLLRSKFTSSITHKVKESKWEGIAGKVTAIGNATRGWKQVREKWNQLVSKAKEAYGRVKSHQRGTGGGAPMPDLDPVTERIIDIYKDDASFNGVEGGFESRIVPPLPKRIRPSANLVTNSASAGQGDSSEGDVPVVQEKVVAELSVQSGFQNTGTGPGITSTCSQPLVFETIAVDELGDFETMALPRPPKSAATGKAPKFKSFGTGKKNVSQSSRATEDLHVRVLEATLQAQQEIIATQRVKRQQAELQVEKLKLEIEVLKERRDMAEFTKYIEL